jgi:DNA-binding MarR family transcriptional regulator
MAAPAGPGRILAQACRRRIKPLDFRLEPPTPLERPTSLVTPAPEPAQLEPADFQSLGEFRRAIREFLAFSEESAREQGVTPQQHQALLAIKAHTGDEPMSIGELADSLLIKNHSAVGLVARLVERGLVRRHASEADRRRVLLTLEPRGEEILARISGVNIRKLAGAAKSLRRVLATLKKLENAQSAKGGSAEPDEG